LLNILRGIKIWTKPTIGGYHGVQVENKQILRLNLYILSNLRMHS